MNVLIILVFMSLAFCCTTKPDLNKERAMIMSLLNMERKAHFEKNASMFMSEFSDGMIP